MQNSNFKEYSKLINSIFNDKKFSSKKKILSDLCKNIHDSSQEAPYNDMRKQSSEEKTRAAEQKSEEEVSRKKAEKI